MPIIIFYCILFFIMEKSTNYCLLKLQGCPCCVVELELLYFWASLFYKAKLPFRRKVKLKFKR